MADFYVLVHPDVGPLATFLTREEADEAVEEVFGDESGWVRELWVEPFDVVVAEPSRRQ